MTRRSDEVLVADTATNPLESLIWRNQHSLRFFLVSVVLATLGPKLGEGNHRHKEGDVTTTNKRA